MPRIPYPDPATQPEWVRKILEMAPMNVVRITSLASEGVYEAFNQFSQAVIWKSALPPDLREIGILRVGYLSKAAYEVYHHEAAAREAGLTEAQISAIKRGDVADPSLSAVQQAVLAFTDDVVMNVRASDATLSALRSHVTDPQLIDLMMAIGWYMMISRILETSGVELDAAPVSFKR